MRQFSAAFGTDLFDLMKWRRDVRHFKTGAVDPATLQTCLRAFSLAPSVGLSQPWRLVRVKSATKRAQALANFNAANRDALAGYDGEKATLYARLKLTGMQDAPEHLAIFCDDTTEKGAGLGAQSMPEMRRYSVVCGIMSFWLVARAHGLGVGWVSILDPDKMAIDLEVPENWRLVAYLCVGWPKDVHEVPELETLGWERREAKAAELIER